MNEYHRIIFIDENGTCRAPMAAEILKENLSDASAEILPRGMVVLFPEPLNQKAEAVMISNGIHIDDYRTVQLSEEDVDDSTLVICFEDSQWEKIRQALPDSFPEERIRVLHDIVGDELEIMNPYGAPLPSYGLLFETLNKSITRLARMLEAGTV